MAYNASQLVALATQIAKAPGYLTQAGVLLNLILQDLCDNYDWDFIRQTAPAFAIDSSAASYALPADYLRAREVFYDINGTVFYLSQDSLANYDQYFKGSGVMNYPQFFATDVSTNPVTMYFWPPPAQPLSLTIRYQPNMPDITSPETSTEVPWFQNQRYLLKKLAADIMMITEDSRQAEFEKQAEGMLTAFIKMTGDQEGYVKTVQLDSRKFRSTNVAKATKQTVW